MIQSLCTNGVVYVNEDFGYYGLNISVSNKQPGYLYIINELDKNTHQIFFGDGIRSDKLVDIWGLFQKKRIGLDEGQDIFWHDVDTIGAVTDTDYFIKKFNLCVENKEKLD